MSHKVCPWWLGYFLIVSFRRRVQDPAAILRPFVAEGMTVLEPGPGMGYFTLELARRVGPSGKVVAVDVQPAMLSVLRRRAGKAGLSDRVETRLAPPEGMGVEDLRGRVDFVLAFAVVHEIPGVERFFADAYAAMKPGGRLLLAEPRHHVPAADFEASISAARAAGFRVAEGPAIRWSLSAVLVKEGGT